MRCACAVLAGYLVIEVVNTNLKEQLFEGLSQVGDQFLPLVSIRVNGLTCKGDEVIEVGAGAVVADHLPDYSGKVEKDALETEYKWNPLVVHYKGKTN